MIWKSKNSRKKIAFPTLELTGTSVKPGFAGFVEVCDEQFPKEIGKEYYLGWHLNFEEEKGPNTKKHAEILCFAQIISLSDLQGKFVER